MLVWVRSNSNITILWNWSFIIQTPLACAFALLWSWPLTGLCVFKLANNEYLFIGFNKILVETCNLRSYLLIVSGSIFFLARCAITRYSDRFNIFLQANKHCFVCLSVWILLRCYWIACTQFQCVLCPSLVFFQVFRYTVSAAVHEADFSWLAAGTSIRVSRFRIMEGAVSAC